MKTIYVITWAYGDGSGFGVVGALTDPDRALAMLAFVKKFSEGSGRNFSIVETPLDL